MEHNKPTAKQVNLILKSEGWKYKLSNTYVLVYKGEGGMMDALECINKKLFDAIDGDPCIGLVNWSGSIVNLEVIKEPKAVKGCKKEVASHAQE